MKQKGASDPVRCYVECFADEVRLLCLDEFQVTDVADAMLLRNLFSCMFDAGLFVLVTSNRHPQELYMNGLQRASFVPCIDLLERRLDVVSLYADKDYRTQHEPSGLSFSLAASPITTETMRFMERCFAALCRGAQPEARVLSTLGREIRANACLGKVVAKFTFGELCAQPLSAADYICFASTFKTIILTNVPILTFSRRDEARRFITLIDILYDNRVQLILQSEAPLDELFQLHKKPNVQVPAVRVLADDLSLTDKILVIPPFYSSICLSLGQDIIGDRRRGDVRHLPDGFSLDRNVASLLVGR